MLPPDSTPKRCNTLYLAGKACEKEYEQLVRTPFAFSTGKTCFMEGTPYGGIFIVSRKPRHDGGVQ